MNPIARYTHWLHTRWPAGTVEKMPAVDPDGTTAVPGIRVVGDLTGIPLLKFSAHTGAMAVRNIAAESDFKPGASSLDIAIIGAGVSGLAAAMEAQKRGLRYQVFEAAERFSTIVNFPKAKPIYTYPTEMVPAGDLQVSAPVKESLLEELAQQVDAAGVKVTSARVERLERRNGEIWVHLANGEPIRAQRAIVAIGRSGNYRKLGVPGQDLDKVYHRLYDPKEYSNQDVLVVGGGDSALETAIALAHSGARVVLSYRKPEFSRPKPDNLENLQKLQVDPSSAAVVQPVSDRVTTATGDFMPKPTQPGSIRVMLGSKLHQISPESIRIEDAQGKVEVLPNQVVFAMIGREAPLDFFRRSGVPIRGEWRAATWASFLAFFTFCIFIYNWKAGGALNQYFKAQGWFPFQMKGWLAGLAQTAQDPSTILGTLAITLEEPGFYYSLAYSLCVILFGFDRIRRRRTPYIRLQTASLMTFQVVPLFLLPYLVLPLLGHNGAFDSGWARTFADNFFPAAGYGHGREYWRAFGFILAWPLFIWNFFTEQPMVWWLVVGSIQTFVIIPAIVWRWGKGAYCGWICSCGALAETLGDRFRSDMPHGPKWNRLNMVGQAALLFAAVLFLFRILSWSFPNTGWGQQLARIYRAGLSDFSVLGVSLDYYHTVDIFLAGIVGVGLYFWFSGRVWCRFACPLAALMHIYARFSQFRIFAEKSKCISCNVCTSVCHQGIDIMNFANKGLPMQDPECVRCSACVEQCPTGTLSFGRVNGAGLITLGQLQASAVRLREAKNG